MEQALNISPILRWHHVPLQALIQRGLSKKQIQIHKRTFTADGRFYPDNLWTQDNSNGTTRIRYKKLDYFIIAERKTRRLASEDKSGAISNRLPYPTTGAEGINFA